MNKTLWKFKNLPHRFRGWKHQVAFNLEALALALAGYGGNVALRAKVMHLDGSITDLGIISRRSVTNAGVAFLTDAFQNLVEIEAMNWHDCGTGVVAENVTDTGLGTPAGTARVSGTQTEPATNQYRTTATIAFTGTLAITEHGVFSASTAGTLWDRSLFSAVNVVNGESIQFQYTLTVNAGG